MPLLIACGGNDDNTRDNILHLRGLDISEADLMRFLSREFTDYLEVKIGSCLFANQGLDQFVSGLTRADELADQQGVRSSNPYGTPVPGQKADRASYERFYVIMREVCGFPTSSR
jgi:hypothetical protein